MCARAARVCVRLSLFVLGAPLGNRPIRLITSIGLSQRPILFIIVDNWRVNLSYLLRIVTGSAGPAPPTFVFLTFVFVATLSSGRLFGSGRCCCLRPLS